MIMPSIESRLISSPAMSSARKPPVNASGIVNMTMNGDLRSWNCATITRYTSRIPTASIKTSCLSASTMDSRSPVKPMVVPSEGENEASASSAASVTSVTLQPSAMSAVTSMYRRWLRRRMLERLSVSSTVAMSLSATECTVPSFAVTSNVRERTYSGVILSFPAVCTLTA